MTTRRSFLTLLGLGAVAAPAVAKAAQETFNVPDVKGRATINAVGVYDDNVWIHSHTITPSDGSHTHSISMQGYVDWRRKVIADSKP